MDKVRVGIIGAGGRANFQAKSILESGKGELKIVFSPVEEEAKKFGEKYQIEYVLDWRKVIERGNIDAVTVSTPNSTHYEIVSGALKAGKHALVEYPMALKNEDAAEMIKLSKEKNLVLWVSLTERLENPHITIKGQLNSIGKPFFASAAYIAGGLRGWYADTSLRGDPFAALQFHFIDQFRELFGEVREVNATVNEEKGKDGKLLYTASSMMLTFKNGCNGFVEFGMGIPPGTEFREKIIGTKGYFDFVGGKLIKGTATVKEEITLLEAKLAVDTADYLNSILAGKGMSPAEDGKKSLEVALATARSAQEGMRVKL